MRLNRCDRLPILRPAEPCRRPDLMDWRARSAVAASCFAALAFGSPLQGTARGDASAAPQFSRQDDRGALAGRVAGPGDDGLANVTVTVSGATLVLSRSVTTTGHGAFRFDDLPPGAYTLTFTLDRLVLDERRDLMVIPGVCTRVDAKAGPTPVRDGSSEAFRSAFNRFTGSAHLRLVDSRLQWDNLSPDLKADGAGLGSPVHRVTEAELEAGGPIRRDLAWVRASASRATKDVGLIGFYVPACLGADHAPIAGAADRADCLQSDLTTTIAFDVESQFRWTPAHRSTLAWGASDRR